MRRGRTVLAATGGWTHDNGDNLRTRIQGSFNSNNIGAYVADMGFTSVVRDSDIKAEYRLDWPGLPSDFDRAELSGDVQWLLGPGYLRDVPDAARIFSVAQSRERDPQVHTRFPRHFRAWHVLFVIWWYV